MQATSKEVAINAVRLLYIGKSFIPLTIFLFVMEFCKIRVPQILTNGLIAFHFIIVLLVFTCQNNSLFYTTIDYTKEGLFPHLVLGHGIFYYVFMTMNVLYLLTITVICIINYIKSSNRHYRKHLLYILALSVVMTAGLFAYLLRLTQGYDTTALAYLISATLLLLAIIRDNLLDALIIAKDYILDNLTEGIIILSSTNEILYFNELARSLYPELDSSNASLSIADIQDKVKQHTNIFSQDNVYRISCQDIYNNSRSYGKIFLLNDITGSYNYTERLKNEIEKKTLAISKIQHSVIASFANMVEARDGITGQHVKRTSSYVAIIAKALQQKENYHNLLTDDYVELIIDAAPLHDIGKISIPDAIITKPGKLTEEEFKTIQSHCETGVQIINETLSEVESSAYLNVAKNMAHYHHEKWNGTGYPSGLLGKDIPLCARIMAIADVYDALRSERSYKKAFSKEEALTIIIKDSGIHFDPDIVDVFVENIHKIEAITEQN